jgi:hypothetical protein
MRIIRKLVYILTLIRAVVIDLKQLLALGLVAGVPDGSMEYPGVLDE